jgi:hypothetical protein
LPPSPRLPSPRADAPRFLIRRSVARDSAERVPIPGSLRTGQSHGVCFAFLTVMLTAVEVAVAPLLSVATAVREYVPAGALAHATP